MTRNLSELQEFSGHGDDAASAVTHLDAYLHSLVEKACIVTDSNLGGALLLFGKMEGDHTAVRLASRGQLSATTSMELELWRGAPRSLPAELIAVGEGTMRMPLEPEPRNVAQTGASCLRLPWLDGERIIGVLVLEASRSESYEDHHVTRCRALLCDAIEPVFRLILKQNMAGSGLGMEMIGASPAFLELEQQLRAAAQASNFSVLLTGERGTGKEFAAMMVHFLSERHRRPFVPILCSAFSENLAADELFGHERHSFTGATGERSGRIKAAEGGTVFLDEVGDIPKHVQPALLRVLEHRELQRLGRDVPLTADFRVIAATNRDLEELIADGDFRDDLRDRLACLEIRVPPLRERLKDIPRLAKHYLRKACHELERPMIFGECCKRCNHQGEGSTAGEASQWKALGCATPEFLDALSEHTWPGNIRELEHEIFKLVATIQAKPLNPYHFLALIQVPTVWTSASGKSLTLRAGQKEHVARVLRITDQNISRAAKILGIPYSTFRTPDTPAKIPGICAFLRTWVRTKNCPLFSSDDDLKGWGGTGLKANLSRNL